MHPEMARNGSKHGPSRLMRTKWFLPAFSLLLGTIFLVAFLIGDDTRSGVFSFGVMAALAVLILLGGRSELVRGLRGDGRDEYWAGIDERATLFTGNIAIAMIIGMSAWEWAHGRSGTPYVQLGSVCGLVYIVALAVSRWRS
jgi:hypothetical protein